MSNIMAMLLDINRGCVVIQANIADFKNHLSEYIEKVQAGASIEICKRNKAIAVVHPRGAPPVNQTRLGSGKGTVKILADLTEPVLESEWEMLDARDERSS
jgi:prevent-host-death family protein